MIVVSGEGTNGAMVSAGEPPSGSSTIRDRKEKNNALYVGTKREQHLDRAISGEALPIERLEIYCFRNGMILAIWSAIGMEQDVLFTPILKGNATGIRVIRGHGILHGSSKNAYTPTTNAIFQTDGIDSFDSDCDEVLQHKQISWPISLIMVQMFSLSEVVHSTPSPDQQESMIMHVIEEMPNQLVKCNADNQENKLVNKSLTVKLEKYKERVKMLEERQNIDLNSREKLIDLQMNDMVLNRNAKFVAFQKEINTLKSTLSKNVKENESLMTTIDYFIPQKEVSSEQAFWVPISNPISKQPAVQHTPVKTEVPRKLLKVSLVKKSFQKLKNHLAKFDKAGKVRTTVSSRESFKDFDNGLHLELNEKELLIENDRLLELIISQDLVHTAMNSYAAIVDYKKMKKSYIDEYNECLDLKAELSKKKDMIEQDVFIELSKSYSKLEQHCISLEIAIQQKQAKVSNPLNNALGHAYLKVAFRKHSCFVRDLEGVDLLKGSRGINLDSISLEDMLQSSPICLLSKVSKTKSWLWHRRLSHLNFVTINQLAKEGLVKGLPKLKYEKDHLCSACLLGKSKKHSHKPKAEDSNQEKLYLLHMDLYGQMRVESIHGKKYILVIVDDFSRNIKTDNGTEFVNQTMRSFYGYVGITHQTTVARTPQQNGVVERRNRTLVEVARTMLIFSKASLFLWTKAVATACYTQNRSLIRTRHNKTPYELLHDRKPDLRNLHVFGALCYPTNNSKYIGMLKPKAEIGIFIGYSPAKNAYQIYNKKTRMIMETLNVEFDELTAMASEQFSLGPAPNLLTPGYISSELVQNPSFSTPNVPPSKKD
ncbi:retrovirus-related pol polyprotein from transposon TNT 1-94 [Tanacetum coccineum]